MVYNPLELLGESDRLTKEWADPGLWGQVQDFLLGGLNLVTTLKGDPVAEIIGGQQPQSTYNPFNTDELGKTGVEK